MELIHGHAGLSQALPATSLGSFKGRISKLSFTLYSAACQEVTPVGAMVFLPEHSDSLLLNDFLSLPKNLKFQAFLQSDLRKEGNENVLSTHNRPLFY